MAWLLDLEQAGKLIGDLELPADAERLLSESQFWHEAVFLVVCGQCDHLVFTEPRKGFELAERLPRFADHIPLENCGIRSPGILKGLAFACYGAGLRAIGRHEDSEVAYMASGLLLRDAPLEDRAMFWRRLTYLRISQRDLDKGLETAESAVRIARRIEAHELGKSLMWRGLVHWYSNRVNESLRDFSASLVHLDPERDERSRRYYFSVTFNFGVALESSAAEPAAVQDALSHISRARSLAHFEAGTLPVVKMIWAEARCQEKLGEMEASEAGFRDTREGMAALGIPFEYALVSLDLAAAVFARGDFVEVAQIAADLWPIFKSLKLSRDDEAYAAVLLFYKAARALDLTASMIDDARRKLRSHDLAQG